MTQGWPDPRNASPSPYGQPVAAAAPEPAPWSAAPTWPAAQPASPPQYELQLDPAPVQLAVHDQQRNTMAAVITLIALIIGLWGALGYLHATTRILGGINTSSNQILVKMATSQTGLASLQIKTAKVQPMAASTVQLAAELKGVNTSMGAMLTNVNALAGSMRSMNRSVTTLSGSLDVVNATNARLGTSLTAINTGLGDQAKAVHSMMADVQASSTGLAALPPRLTASGSRLTFINSAVCTLGQKGVSAPTNIHIGFLGLNTGSADITATLIPTGAWTC